LKNANHENEPKLKNPQRWGRHNLEPMAHPKMHKISHVNKSHMGVVKITHTIANVTLAWFLLVLKS
jgi:hypothetical protein